MSQKQRSRPIFNITMSLFGSSPAGIETLNFTAITTGSTHTCALLTGGGVKCWGENRSGQLGDGTGGNMSNTPVDVIGLAGNVTAISAGTTHTCAILTGGGLQCWGNNESGQLGNGAMQNRAAPENVSGMAANVTAIAVGGAHTCALVGAGRPKCWGENTYGQLGVGKAPQRLTPVCVIERLPSLGFNYAAGLPGSFFTLTGWDFPPGASLTLSINNQVLTTTLTVNPTGSFIMITPPPISPLPCFR